MVASSQMTAAEFAATKHELPEAGRWHELHEGNPVVMEPPDDAHGTTVLNLSRALADWMKGRDVDEIGYACHEIGIGVSDDTVYCPALSFFNSGPRFEQSDQVMATLTPALIVEVASSNDRRQDIRRRTLAYSGIGVATIWVVDPQKKEIQVLNSGAHTLCLAEWQQLDGSPLLPDFAISVKDLFAQPGWWK